MYIFTREVRLAGALLVALEDSEVPGTEPADLRLCTHQARSVCRFAAQPPPQRAPAQPRDVSSQVRQDRPSPAWARFLPRPAPSASTKPSHAPDKSLNAGPDKWHTSSQGRMGK